MAQPSRPESRLAPGVVTRPSKRAPLEQALALTRPKEPPGGASKRARGGGRPNRIWNSSHSPPPPLLLPPRGGAKPKYKHAPPPPLFTRRLQRRPAEKLAGKARGACGQACVCKVGPRSGLALDEPRRRLRNGGLLSRFSVSPTCRRHRLTRKRALYHEATARAASLAPKERSCLFLNLHQRRRRLDLLCKTLSSGHD